MSYRDKKFPKRCPWCGKNLIERKESFKKIHTALAPARCCPHCSNYVTTLFSTCILGFLLWALVYLYIGNKPFILFIILLVLGLVCLSSLVLACLGMYRWHRLKSDGKTSRKKQNSNEIKYMGRIGCESTKSQIILTNENFDTMPAFSSSSPIMVRRYYKKSQLIEFVFLYEHSDNQILIEKGSFEAFIPTDEGYSTVHIENIKVKR